VSAASPKHVAAPPPVGHAQEQAALSLPQPTHGKSSFLGVLGFADSQGRYRQDAWLSETLRVQRKAARESYRRVPQNPVVTGSDWRAFGAHRDRARCWRTNLLDSAINAAAAGLRARRRRRGNAPSSDSSPSDLDQERRTSMAAERTWLAWWRTALGATRRGARCGSVRPETARRRPLALPRSRTLWAADRDKKTCGIRRRAA